MSGGRDNYKVGNGDESDRNLYPTSAYIGGLGGGLLSSCLSNGLPSKALLISTNKGIPDPEGAALLLDRYTTSTESRSSSPDKNGEDNSITSRSTAIAGRRKRGI
jgi:PAC2 family